MAEAIDYKALKAGGFMKQVQKGVTRRDIPATPQDLLEVLER